MPLLQAVYYWRSNIDKTIQWWGGGLSLTTLLVYTCWIGQCYIVRIVLLQSRRNLLVNKQPRVPKPNLNSGFFRFFFLVKCILRAAALTRGKRVTYFKYLSPKYLCLFPALNVSKDFAKLLPNKTNKKSHHCTSTVNFALYQHRTSKGSKGPG